MEVSDVLFGSNYLGSKNMTLEILFICVCAIFPFIMLLLTNLFKLAVTPQTFHFAQYIFKISFKYLQDV